MHVFAWKLNYHGEFWGVKSVFLGTRGFIRCVSADRIRKFSSRVGHFDERGRGLMTYVFLLLADIVFAGSIHVKG